ncbi:MAG: hypothetical protein MK193_10450 [Lentisphaeria bacterium]|nr:hypothetical protein [Lentisphaeria bacterium]
MPSKIDPIFAVFDKDLGPQKRYGLPSTHFEFKIPKNEEFKREVLAIDPSLEFFCNSKGRIGADTNECLVIGYSLQHNLPLILENLSDLNYVTKIVPCYWE